MMTKKQREIISILLFMISIFIMVSLITNDFSETPGGISENIDINNWMGRLGADVSYYIINCLLGSLSSIIFPFCLLLYSYVLFTNKINEKKYYYLMLYGLSIAFLTSSSFALYHFWITGADEGIIHYSSGIIAYATIANLIDLINKWFVLLLIIALFIIVHISYFGWSLYDSSVFGFSSIRNFLYNFKNMFTSVWSRYVSKSSNPTIENNIQDINVEDEINTSLNENINIDDKDDLNNEDEIKEENQVLDETKLVEKDNELEQDSNLMIDEEIKDDDLDLDSQKDRKSKYFNYKLPLTNFLSDPIDIGQSVSDEELRAKGEQLIYALETFGVNGKVVRISPGPVITLYEIEPNDGVRVNKFTNLADDLARIMKAHRIRIIAPIPGTKSVGIELPNEKPSIVYLKSIFNSEKYISNDSKLTIGLGKTTSGKSYTFDLSSMPHLLVAGATGSGKSVCINTIISSILYKAKPDEVKFILVDPKKVELSSYHSLVGYHLITASNIDEHVMTTPENAVGILDSAINEMERRFDIFSENRVRNISEYHKKYIKNSDLEKIPYIVVLIDELADLMMTSGRSIEEPITRLAQKARAVGIHLVVATQRPSVDVITGLIKSNFPARIAFQVSSKIDSRTILDQAGAETLLGNGDMLFLAPGSASPIRLHGAYVSLEEIEAILSHIVSQPKPDEVSLPETSKISDKINFKVDGDRDELLIDAAKLIVTNRQASVSLLQRKFRIGYSRAGRLIDELESLGIVSGYSGSKSRDVLVDESYLDEIF